MNTSQNQTKKILETIALSVAILGSLIFVISCLLNVYAYSITPTITPTPTKTATVTRTPLPTITPTETVTPKPPTPSPSPSPVYLTGFDFLADVDATMSQQGYQCVYQQINAETLEVICKKETDTYTVQIDISRVENASLLTFQEILLLEPYDPEKFEIAINEFTALAQLLHQFPWFSIETITPVVTTRPTPSSPTATAASEIETWLSYSLPPLLPDQPIEKLFDEMQYSLLWEGDRLSLTISFETAAPQP